MPLPVMFRSRETDVCADGLDAAHMTLASTLEWVQFEWPTERTARLKIRDNAFTFST